MYSLYYQIIGFWAPCFKAFLLFCGQQIFSFDVVALLGLLVNFFISRDL